MIYCCKKQAKTNRIQKYLKELSDYSDNYSCSVFILHGNWWNKPHNLHIKLNIKLYIYLYKYCVSHI